MSEYLSLMVARGKSRIVSQGKNLKDVKAEAKKAQWDLVGPSVVYICKVQEKWEQKGEK